MAGNLVIVAIADESDRVWKVSSEKVPHLTLLFLGEEATEVSNLDQIVLFVEHAANTTLHRFYLPVDRRGELGEGKADVLFFKKGRYDFKAIRDFRATLLQDANIKKAYDTSSQFETPEYVGAPGQPWIPHLTLGYPESPAKPQTNDQMSTFYEVQFNKIAVWMGDYEGPEFLLNLEDFDMGVIPMDVAMSGIDDLAHYGTKGMRWGQRKATDTGSTPSAPQRIDSTAKSTARFTGDVAFESLRTSKITHHQIIVEASDAFSKKDIPRIEAKPKYAEARKLKNRLLHPLDSVTREYRAEMRNAYINRLEKAANEMKNFSGDREYTIRERGGDLPSSQYFWEVSTRRARHAVDDDNNITMVVEVLMDDAGFITGLKPAPEDNLTQTIDLGLEFLEHYGVRGMRWGVRRDRSSPVAVTPTATSTVPRGSLRKTKIKTEGGENHPAHEDAVKVARAQAKLKKSGTAALSNQELLELQNRLNLERNVSQLVSTTGRVGKGRKFVRDLTGLNRELNEAINVPYQSSRLARQIRTG